MAGGLFGDWDLDIPHLYSVAAVSATQLVRWRKRNTPQSLQPVPTSGLPWRLM
jgi:hypothetical protein